MFTDRTTEGMTKIQVRIHPGNRDISAYRYASNCILVPAQGICNSDKSMVTDEYGFRYVRHIPKYETANSYFFQYLKI